MSDRRTFLVQMGALTASVSVVTGAESAETSAARRGTLEVVDCPAAVSVAPVPVVGFLLDQPYLDLTGQATPYLPPAGLQSAEPLAANADAAFHQGIWFGWDRS